MRTFTFAAPLNAKCIIKTVDSAALMVSLIAFEACQNSVGREFWLNSKFVARHLNAFDT